MKRNYNGINVVITAKPDAWTSEAGAMELVMYALAKEKRILEEIR